MCPTQGRHASTPEGARPRPTAPDRDPEVKVHIRNGPWNEGGGYEYLLLIVLVVVTLAVLGPGAVSLAGALGVEDTLVLGTVL